MAFLVQVMKRILLCVGLGTLVLSFGAAPVANASPNQKVGMFYLIWHCPNSGDPAYNTNPIYDISKAIAGQEAWGPIPAFHWWGQPDAGYYCLANNDAVLAHHAKMLAAAGIDFVFVDATNFPNQAGADFFFSNPFKRWFVSGARFRTPLKLFRGWTCKTTTT